jgi:hypothetical protein
MRYEINENDFSIKIFDDINEEPFWYQPHYPNGDTFDSVEEATTWAELAIQSLDPEYNYFAPDGKGLEGIRKPTPLEVAESKLAGLGLTVNDLRALLGIE